MKNLWVKSKRSVGGHIGELISFLGSSIGHVRKCNLQVRCFSDVTFVAFKTPEKSNFVCRQWRNIPSKQSNGLYYSK